MTRDRRSTWHRRRPDLGPVRSAVQPAALPAIVLLSLMFLPFLPAAARGQVDARMFRQPDVSERHIAFVYAGDIWLVEKEGGTAHRLSSPPGQEHFPRFSPDGSTLAYTANYDGNDDVYRVTATGGEAVRLTHHPLDDRLVDWYPNGSGLLLASSRHSGRQRFSQFFRLSREGGLPSRLPVPYAEFGSISGDGQWIAYTPKSRAFRTWKRYRGGWAPDIWLFNLETLESRKVTDDPANDDQPMFHGRTLYFLSDRGPARRHNIWAHDLDTGDTRQVTQFTDLDVHFPAIGPSDMVFQAGSRLYLMDLETEEVRPVDIRVVTDRSTLRPRTEQVGDDISSGGISPSGKRAVFEARGDVFTVPAEHGPVRNLTRSSGVAERSPAWSPDGEHVAYWTDRGGEYQLALRRADGTGGERVLTSFEDGYRYRPYWSPDSGKLAYVDQAMRIQVLDVESGEVTTVDRGLWMTHGSLSGFSADWSADSRWLTWSRGLENRNGTVFLYDTRDGEKHRVTSSFYHDSDPTFGADGKYLFFRTNRSFDPVYSDYQFTFVYPNATSLVAVPLRRDVPSPLHPRSDEEEPDGDAEEEEDEGGRQDRDESGGDEEGQATDAAPEPVEIDLEGFESRIVELPPEPGNYGDLAAASGKLVYRRFPRSGSGGEESPLLYWDLEEREEKTVMGEVDGYALSADGKKVLVANDGRFAIVDLAPEQKMEETLATSDMTAPVEPEREWRQLFADAWRFTRDYFYDPDMHGVDWEAVREQYASLLEDAVTRWDVNFVIGEMIGELNASHTYRFGGDVEQEESRPVGMLGVNWEVANGAYRIAGIVRPAPWVSEVSSPLARPGVDVEEGDYVLAVNGVPLTTERDPWAALEGLASETVELTVSDGPDPEGARTVLVETLSPSEDLELRHFAWIHVKRQRVTEATDGRVGYIYVPNTGISGQTALVRQFQAQFHREGLIIDERWNSGGQIPDRFVELLSRQPLSWWAVRDGRDWQWPPVAHFGPQAMLINGWSGSGGDAFPYYFRSADRGPLIGTRTWGGLIGISGVPGLVDGGVVTVPTFRMYSPDGEWFEEGHGVDPDIRVEADPTALARGRDTQLERAIEWVMEEVRTRPPVAPERPPYEDRSRPEVPEESGGGG